MNLLTDPRFLACAAAVFAGACVQGVGGLGLALVAAPIMALAYPQLVPGPILLVAGSFALLTVLRERGHVDFRAAGLMIGGRIGGSVLAGLIIGLLPRETFGLLFAAVILLAVLLSALGWRVQATMPALVAGGIGSGLMGTITSVGGPPLGIVMQRAEPARLRATIGLCLLVGAFFSIIVLALAGRFGLREAEMGLLLLAPTFVGFMVSSPLRRFVSAAGMRRLVLGVSAASALMLLLRIG
jgi:uncharacterized membrane protein YfcA